MVNGDTMKRIQSNEYFDALQDYFAGQQMPSRVYAFLLDILKADKYKLTDDFSTSLKIPLLSSPIHLPQTLNH